MLSYFEKCNNWYANLLDRISKSGLLKLILTTVFIEVFVTILFSYFLFPNHTSGPKFENKNEEFFIAVIFAPFLETLIFQYVIISYIISKKSKAFLLSCFVSAILFGLSHYYSAAYILKTFLSGLIFGTLYLVVVKKKANAIIVVTIAHALFNFIGFCVKNLIK